MKIICSCCAKQAVDGVQSRNDEYVTTLVGARRDCNPKFCICGYCAEDLDENGLFPEERAF